MKILIVDDSAAMRMMVKKMLRVDGFEGHELSEANDGDVAFEMVKKDVPDLILSDWNMPNMTGLDFLKSLNSEKLTPTFGFITTESTGEMRQKAEAAGAQFMISKPFTQDSFKQALTPYLA